MARHDDDYEAPIRVDTAMILMVDPCQLSQSPDELAALVAEGKAALVQLDMDGWYNAVLDEESVGLVINIDPATSSLVRPEDATAALEGL